MRIVIAGGHGKIALLLEHILAERGDQAVGLVRNPAHVADVQKAGAEAGSATWRRPRPMMSRCCCPELTQWCLPPARSGQRRPAQGLRRPGCLRADGRRRRAGRGPQVRADLLDGAGRPPRPGTDEVWAAYITAKTAAEADLRAGDLDWTILRPGGLTDAPATGKIRLAAPPVPAGTVPRADVAAVIAALLDNPGTRHQTLELTGEDSPVAAAVRNIS